MLDRRRFLSTCSSHALAGTLLPGALYALLEQGRPVTARTIACAEDIAGLSLTDEERELLVEDLNGQVEDYAQLRALELANSVAPSLVFDPRLGGPRRAAEQGALRFEPPAVRRPPEPESLAFKSVAELAHLLKSRQVTSLELTELYLSRLRQHDEVLQAVVTLTEETALEEAARADIELDAGIWRGPLHGVPYGAKDLLSVKGYPTTWGAEPYRAQVIEEDAAVVERLRSAGAVLVAKLTLGALAWGDVWFGGKTRNPWNPDEGSSGSSAGPAAAVAAGLVGFAIGSETLGSIVSPSTRCGVTGHRPTFGLVSRHGAMTLAWSMDKLGPMARSALDCALVFDAVRGQDPRDGATAAASFPFDASMDVAALRVGYLAEAFEGEYANREADRQTLEVLRGLGIDPVPMALPDGLPLDAMLLTLGVEAAAAFDSLTLTRGVDSMVRQGQNTWPHEFRRSRFVPAVEFLQAARARTLLMQRMHETMRDLDCFVAPTFGNSTLRITNLTGHPAVCVPNAFHAVEGSSRRRRPASITFVGGLYKDAQTLALAWAFQRATDFHLKRPPID